jgi:L,D-transpeptidase catalytic domain
MNVQLVVLSLALTTLLAPSILPAQGAKVSSPVEFARKADSLKPGEWVWAPNAVPKGPVLVYIDLSRQIATVYRNGVRIGVTTISSGKENYETPTGVFTILQKKARHYSNLYANAPMPYMQRLTWGGVALHAGKLPGYAQSHGCVRLPYAFSQQLFKITSLGVTIVVEGDAAKKIDTTNNTLLVPMDTKGEKVTHEHLEGAEFRWTPEKSSKGPLTIILSKPDQRVVVLRNGIEIGRSVAQIDDTGIGPLVLSYTIGPDGKGRWFYIDLPSQDPNKGRELEDATRDRVRMPRQFYEALRAQLQPGTTVLVTQSSVGAKPTSDELTIIDAVTPGSSSQP